MSPRPFRGQRLLRLAFLTAIPAALIFPAIVGAASGGWTLTRSPASVDEGVATNVSLTATNTSGGSSVGCVELSIPSAFDVSSVAVDSAPAGYSWVADAPIASGGSTSVTIHAATSASELKTDGLAVDFHVRVTGSTVGSYTWPADSLDHSNCSSGKDSTSVTVAIHAVAPTPTPTPHPTPTPTPHPTPTPTPHPTPTPTPHPTAQPTSAPSTHPTSAPGPTASPTSPATPPTDAPPTPGASSTPAASGSPSGGAPSPSPSGPLSTSPPFDPSPSLAPIASVARPSPGPRGGIVVADGTADRHGSRQDLRGLDGAVTAMFGQLGLEAWSVPAVAMGVPGLIVILAVLFQMVGGLAWLPVARRSLAGVGLRRRSAEDDGPRADQG